MLLHDGGPPLVDWNLGRKNLIHTKYIDVICAYIWMRVLRVLDAPPSRCFTTWWIIYPPPIPEFPGCGRSFSSSFCLGYYFIFIPFSSSSSSFIIMTAQQRRPELFFSSPGLVDGRRRAPKPCFHFPVKKEEDEENHSAGYKAPKEPSDYPTTAHFVSEFEKNETQEKRGPGVISLPGPGTSSCSNLGSGWALLFFSGIIPHWVVYAYIPVVC